MVKGFKNKESEKKEKDDTVDEAAESNEDKKGEFKSKEKKTKYSPVPKGQGGQFVDIGGGVIVPASEVEE